MARHYDPNQPRVPRGHDGGGQWTDGVPKPLSQLDAIFNQRGDDRHEGRVQLAFEGKNSQFPIQLSLSKPPMPHLNPAIFRLGKAIPYIGPALLLYSVWSGYNDEDQQTILKFRARKFRRNEDKTFDLEGVQILTWEEVEKECGEYFRKVQELTDKAYDEIVKDKKLSGGPLGDAVHSRVENDLKDFKKDKKIDDERLKSEKSFAKGDGDDRRGAKDTVRLDVYNRVNDRTLCIDDIMTGKKHRLDYKRMRELIEAISRNEKYNGIERIIVTEVRPRALWPSRRRAPTLQHE
jgi:hypothetical protein